MDPGCTGDEIIEEFLQALAALATPRRLPSRARRGSPVGLPTPAEELPSLPPGPFEVMPESVAPFVEAASCVTPTGPEEEDDVDDLLKPAFEGQDDSEQLPTELCDKQVAAQCNGECGGMVQDPLSASMGTPAIHIAAALQLRERPRARPSNLKPVQLASEGTHRKRTRGERRKAARQKAALAAHASQGLEVAHPSATSSTTEVLEHSAANRCIDVTDVTDSDSEVGAVLTQYFAVCRSLAMQAATVSDQQAREVLLEPWRRATMQAQDNPSPSLETVVRWMQELQDEINAVREACMESMLQLSLLLDWCAIQVQHVVEQSGTCAKGCECGVVRFGSRWLDS